MARIVTKNCKVAAGNGINLFMGAGALPTPCHWNSKTTSLKNQKGQLPIREATLLSGAKKAC